MPGRDGKDQREDSPKEAGTNLYPTGVWFADVMTSFFAVTFVLFCFVFVFMPLVKPQPFVQSSFDMQAPR